MANPSWPDGKTPRVGFLQEGGGVGLYRVVTDHVADIGACATLFAHPRNDRLLTWLWTLWRRRADVFYAMGVQLRGNRFRAAKRLGRRTVLHWIGTDVWYLRTDPEKREAFRRDVLPHIDAHWAVSKENAAGLRDALGVDATIVPIIDYGVTDVPEPAARDAHAAFLYNPRGSGKAGDFYGLPQFLAAARAHPDVPFRVLADDGAEAAEAVPPNVAFLGRVEDMAGIYRTHTVYIRPTQHDGLPKMVIEALAWGCEVIYSQPFPHCRQASTADEVTAAVREVLAVPPRCNRAGREHVRTAYARDRVRRQWEEALAALVGPNA